MDEGQMTHMNSMSGLQLTDNIDFALENIDMYTSSFNWAIVTVEAAIKISESSQTSNQNLEMEKNNKIKSWKSKKT